MRPTNKDLNPELGQRLPDVFSGLTRLQKLGVAGRLIIESAKNENPLRAGLVKTPERFGKAVNFLLSGYESSPEQVVGEGVFPTESRGVVSVNKIEFYSLCEHHMLPFWGEVSVAYYPSDKIIGLSKIPRLVDLFARRLQVQEHLTTDVANALNDLIKPRAVAVRVKGQHLCMMMRGVEKQNSETVSETTLGLDRLTNIEQSRLFGALEGK